MRRMLLLLVAMSVALLLLASGVALAELNSVPDAGTAQVDGQVRDILAVGNRIYLGGDFTHVNGVPRNHLAALDASTGQLIGWDPNANNSVRALALSADESRIYIGGTFTSVGGLNRSRLAALDTTTGTVDTLFRPGPVGSTVRAIAVLGNRLYIGGDFTAVNGLSRGRLALIDGTTGALDLNWAPTANESVRTLSLSADGTRLYAGGGFTFVSGSSRPYLAAIHASAGALDTNFRPPSPNGLVFALVASGGRVYTAEGGPGGAVAAYEGSTGARAWRQSADGDAQAVSLLGGKVHVAGHFEVFSGQSRRSFAAVDAVTGALDQRWTPSANPTFPGVWVLNSDVSRGRLYAGGDFTSISGQPHQRYAQFSDSNVNTAPEAPSGLVARAASASRVDLSWTDNATNESGYTVERSLDGNTGWTVLTSTLPADTTTYSDTNLNANTTYYYRVKATNQAGSSNYSNIASATPSAAVYAFSDDWTGADGAAWNRSKWTTDGGTSATLDVRSNEGRMRFENASGARARAIATMPQAANTEVLMSFRFPSTVARGYLQIFSRSSGNWVNGYPGSAYYVELTNSGTNVGLRKVSSGTVTELTNNSVGQATTAKQWVRCRVEGSTLQAKVWTDGTPEPSGWETVATDPSVTAPGVLQLKWVRSSTATDAREVYLDDLTVRDLGP